ncbi:MAG: hypothetical protein K5768_06310 [Firmicutes bacterium]|nr:hypothetical protein [Bacillota bacterium]
MKFTTNRGLMFDYLKSMIHIVMDISPIKELCGFLIEANEDEGYVYITASNIETSIQRKVQARVEEGGSFVMDAKFLVGVLGRLSGNDVIFKDIKKGYVQIKSGKCTYERAALDAANFPKIEIPFPDDLIPIRCIRQLYNGTHYVSGTEKNMNSMSGIHVEITSNSIKAFGCNGVSLSVVEDNLNTGKNASFTLSKKAFSQLVSAIDDNDLLQVGFCNNSAVFIKHEMVFMTKVLQYEFANVQKLLDSISPVYTAKLEYDDMKNEISNMFNLSMAGKEKSYIKCTFKEHEIELETENDVCSTKASIPCVLVGDAAEYTFYYSSKNLKNILSMITGTMVLRLDKRGYLLIFNRMNKYMTTPVSSQLVAAKEKKIAAVKSGESVKQVKKKKSKEPQKAA